MNHRRRAGSLSVCALFTALLALCSQLSIPLPGVPINMALFAVYLGALLLPTRQAVSSVLAYLLLGAFGVPVFSGFSSGPAVLAGPTGGFLAGYPLCALLVSRLRADSASAAQLFLCALAGLFVCSACGMIWFLLSTGTALSAPLAGYFLLFLPGDLIKIVFAVLLAKRLKKPLRSILS